MSNLKIQSEDSPSIALVSCTSKDESNFQQTLLGKSLKKHSCLRPIIFFNNKDGLSTCYNKGIQIAKDDGFTKILFVHDDVSLVDSFLLEKVDKGLTLFDIIGVAGSTSFELSRGLDSQYKKIAWHLCAPREHWTGSVEHPWTDASGKISDLMTYTSYFGPTPRQCATIDGLLIAMNLNSVGDKIKFDENFKFDFYDLSLCIRAHEAKLKVGTMNIHVMHGSHGKGILDPSYQTSQDLFLKLYRTT